MARTCSICRHYFGTSLPTSAHYIKTIDKLLARGIMSQQLRIALNGLKKALHGRKLGVAAEISSVKSLICGTMNADPHECPFREDSKYNEKTVGYSVYDALGHMHHELSLAGDQIPSGVTIIGGGGIQSRGQYPYNDPVVKFVTDEREKLYERLRREQRRSGRKGYRGRVGKSVNISKGSSNIKMPNFKLGGIVGGKGIKMPKFNLRLKI